MVRINNSTTINEAVEGGRLSSVNGIPTELQTTVVPVMEVNPKLLRRVTIVRQGVATNSTSGSIYTCSADKDTYLVAFTCSVIKDTTSTSTLTTLKITPFGDNTARELLRFPGITLTAQTATLSLSLPSPIKLARGSSIDIINGTNVATIIAAGTVYLYEDDSRN